ncbi:MAG: guanylate kinase [Isosphaeraceae bacterium]
MLVEGRGRLPGQLVVVSGPSGSGKSTVVRRALDRGLRRKPGTLRLSVSATTRSMRPGETEGIDYYFLEHSAFEAAIGRNEFLEYATYNDHLYGTPARPVIESLASGETILLEIDVQGAIQVRRHTPGALFVFIRTPTFRVLEDRLSGRGTETELSLFRRLRRAREELAEAHWYDVQLTNDDLNRCVDEFLAVLESHDCGG